MAIRLFPRGHIGSRPPTGPFTINRDSPQRKGLLAWWPMLASRGGAVVRDLANSWHGSYLAANVTWVIDPDGGWALQTDSSTTLGRTNFGDIDVAGDITVVCRLTPLRKASNYESIVISKWNTGGSAGTNEWTLGMNWHVTGTDWYPGFAVEIGTTTYSVTHTTQWNANEELFVAGVRQGTTIYIYRSLPVSKSLVSNSAVCGSGSINNVAGRVVRLGEIAATGSVNTYARYTDVRVYDRALTAPELQQIFVPETRWDLYLPAAPPRFWSVPAIGGPVELEVQDATHAHASEAPALIQQHVLSVADASHAHTAEVVALVQAHLLAIQDVTHDHTVDNVALIQAHLLAVADVSHAHTADNIALLQAYLLAVQDSTHTHSADNVDLIQAYLLAVAGADHAHTVDNITLSLAALLEVQDVSHAHSADNVDLLQAYFLSVADAAHAHAADNLDLLQAFILTVADASHGHTSDNVTLSLAALLEVQDVTHVHTVNNLDLIQAHLLAVADTLHTHTAENVDLIQGFVLTVADATHGHTADNVDISSSILLVVADVLHAHDVESPALLQAYVLTVADATHVHISDNVDLLQAYVLAVQDSMHVHTADNISLTSLGVPGLATLLDAARTAATLSDAQVGNVVILDDDNG